MSLSASTLALFVFLVPGLIFRSALYWMASVRRAFFGISTIYSSIAVIFFALTIHVVMLLGSALFVMVAQSNGWPARLPLAFERDGELLVAWPNQDAQNLTSFVLSEPLMFCAYLALAIAVALILAWLVRAAADRWAAIGRALYGPIAQMIAARKTSVITCFVVTKIQYQSKNLAYAGWPQEISLREGNNIDHVVLRNPEKFFVKLNEAVPITSYNKARPLSSMSTGDTYLYLDKTDFHNVHFEAYSLFYSRRKR